MNSNWSSDMSTGRESSNSLEREVFIEALERPDAKQRSDFLDSASGTNVELRRNVEDLLREADDLGGFLQEPVLAAAEKRASAHEDAGFLAAPITEQSGDYIGRYKLI